jgi:hypothetical protein
LIKPHSGKMWKAHTYAQFASSHRPREYATRFQAFLRTAGD